ncbi:hypothetical protein [Streptomyces tendae]|uniref:hypothetical protein n=1 Tax=Streptomyces tendae TaxID=1932 RepID=UPI003687FD9A
MNRTRPAGTSAVRLENIARFLGFVSESIARAAEQAREILNAAPAALSDVGAPSAPDAADGSGPDGPEGTGRPRTT